MKKTLLSLIVGFVSITTTQISYADDLLSIYELAKNNDPVVLKAQAQYMASKESIDQARAILLPQINLRGGYSTSKSESQNFNDAFGTIGSTITSTRDTTNYSASLNMQLYHHDSWLRMSNAKKSAHRSDLFYQIAKQDLIIRVTQAYFKVLSTKDDFEFAVAEKEAIARQLEQTKQRFSVGLTAITDVHEAQAQFDNAVTEEIRAQNSIYSAEEELRVITNVYPRNLDTLDTTLFSTTRPIPDSADEWQTQTEAKSIDLIAAKVSVDIASKNIDISRAGHYPTLDLSGNYGASKSASGFEGEIGSINFPTTKFYDTQSVGITLNVPIYSGGATSSITRQAQQNYVSASQDLALTHRSIVRTTRNAYNTVIAAISAIKALEQAVLSAEKALEATEAGFEVGTRTIVDVLNSTRNLYNAKRNLSTTRYGYIQNILLLKRSAGMITEQDIADINKGLKSAM